MSGPRIEREKRTARAMIRLYCRGLHGGGETLCAGCEELLRYAWERLDRCPFGEGKPVCSHCPIHCYNPRMRERVREVMRWAGPRLLRSHPILAARHLIDEIRGRAARARGSRVIGK